MTQDQRLDPVTFEVLRNAFETIVDEMGERILRTCHSFVIWCRDFSNTILDPEGNLVSMGTQDLASHVGTLHFTCKAVIKYFGDDINPGDVFVINDPYEGSTHFPDVRVVRPIFVGDKLLGYAQSIGHWADIGGNVPGSFDVTAKTHFSEGLRIPAIRVWDKGRLLTDIVELIVSNTRAPDDARGDLLAQAEATRLAESELLRLVDKYGYETIVTAFAETQDHAERLTRAKVAELPNGSWVTEDYLDQDPMLGEGLIPIRIKMTIDDDSIHYDLTGSHPVVNCYFNASFGTTYSALFVGTKMFFPDVPLNSGLYRVVTATLPENSVVNASWPAAVAGSVSGAFEKIVNAVLELWSSVLPHRALACSFNLEYLEVGGWDERADDAGFFMWYDWLSGGWGGRNGDDGPCLSSIFGVGLRVQPFEGQERLAPVVTSSHTYVPDSAGPGQFRGGLGVKKGGVLTKAKNVVMSCSCDRARSITWGINGGLPSTPHGVWLNKDVPEWHKGEGREPNFLGAVFANVPIDAGDFFMRSSGGGGGYGDPLLRDPQRVVDDVADGYVTPERAELDYGVVVKEVDADLAEWEFDAEATEAARNYIRENRRGWINEDAEAVAERFRKGEVDVHDLVRRYGVILDWQKNELLPKTTDQFRAMMKRRVPYLADDSRQKVGSSR